MLKFFRLCVPCIAYQDSHMQVMSAALLDSDWVVVAISATGSTKDIINSTQMAIKSGARTIGIIGREKSPLGRICDCNLPVYSQETALWLAPMSTRIAQLALLDALFVSVAMKRFEDFRDNPGKVKQTLIEKRYWTQLFESGDIIEAEIEGIGVLANHVEGVDVNPRFAERIDLKKHRLRKGVKPSGRSYHVDVTGR